MTFAKKHQQPESPSYIRGYLFGKSLPRLKTSLGKLKEYVKYEESFGHETWFVRNTTLSSYAAIQRKSKQSSAQTSFKDYLLEKLRALGDGATLKILDIGGCDFTQWKEMSEHPNLELRGTSLTSNSVHPSMRHLVRVCGAHELHKLFPKNHFDIIVAHYSCYFQEMEAVENALYLAKPGGEIIFSGEDSFFELQNWGNLTGKNPVHEKLFEIMAYEPAESYSFHLRKRPDAPLEDLLHNLQKNSLFGRISGFLRGAFQS
ncbi:MAG: hypothetical protein WC861_04745 [Candidatus Micrarchaeia archaeon]|jgi:hypothetical protein